MSPEVSHLLALVISSLNLDRQVALEFVAEFQQAQTLDDLPEWVREFAPPEWVLP